MDNLDALEARLRAEAEAMYGDEPEMSLYSEAAEAIRELRAELKQANDVFQYQIGNKREECEQLRATCESMRRDAERYRWLRGSSDATVAVYERVEDTVVRGEYMGEFLDAAIDAAQQCEGWV